jgi:hypothetical protein
VSFALVIGAFGGDFTQALQRLSAANAPPHWLQGTTTPHELHDGPQRPSIAQGMRFRLVPASQIVGVGRR